MSEKKDYHCHWEHAHQQISPISATYSCKSIFSYLTHINNLLRTLLTDKHYEDQWIIIIMMLESDIKRFFLKKQTQRIDQYELSFYFQKYIFQNSILSVFISFSFFMNIFHIIFFCQICRRFIHEWNIVNWNILNFNSLSFLSLEYY